MSKDDLSIVTVGKKDTLTYVSAVISALRECRAFLRTPPRHATTFMNVLDVLLTMNAGTVKIEGFRYYRREEKTGHDGPYREDTLEAIITIQAEGKTQ